jgi:predicted transposase YbfD/YdcC
LEIYVHREKAHGRKAERIYVKSQNVGWLQNTPFKHVVCITAVITLTTIHDNSVRYYVSSIDLPVMDLGKVIRKHWQIENNLHWVLDMYFYEDRSRTRKDFALENLALLRKLVYNIIKLDDRYDKINKNGNLVKLSIKRKINRYNLYPDEFEELLFSFLPGLIQ